MTRFTLFLALIAMCETPFAQPGTLDTTFSSDGIVTTSFGAATDIARAVARQSDGKLVIAGGTGSGSSTDFVVARYNTDGTIDQSFGIGGKVTTALSGGDDHARAVAIQADGKIVAAGVTTGANFYDFAIVRYNSNGTLDNTFGTAGVVKLDLASVEEANAVAIQPDGKILVAGGYGPAFIGDFLIARYNTNGSIDNTFNGIGYVTLNFGTLYDRAQDVVLQSNGKIVVTGGALQVFNGEFATARLNTNGTPDSTFSSDGLVTTNIVGDEEAYGVAVQTDGKIITVGKGTPGGPNDFILVRYNSDGTLDNTFGSGGQVVTAVGSAEDFAYAVRLQADGKIVVAGLSSNGTNDDFVVVRYNTDGTLDNTFDSDGKVRTDFGSSTDQAYAMLLQPDGKIVAAGKARIDGSDDLALARYNTDGTLDGSFGNGGKVTTDNGPDDVAFALGIHTNGDIAVGGGSGGDFAVVRYNADGTLDNNFSADGKVTMDLGGQDVAKALMAQIDDKILLAGVSDNGSSSTFAFARFNAFGLLDNSFNGNGLQHTTIGTFSGANGVKLQPDNKIVAAGFTSTSSNSDFALVRLNTTGSVDNTFNGTGIVTTDFGSNDDIGRSVALQSDGKIIVAGSSAGTFALARYKTNGSLDSTFSADGKVTTSNGASSECTSVAIQADGKIVAGGSADGSFAIVRYDVDGSLDNTFGSSGKVTTSIGSAAIAHSLTIQQDGRLVLAGESDNAMAFARYNTDGSLDANFGSGGIATIPLASGASAHSVIMQTNGKILAAGVSNNGINMDFASVRLNGLTPPISTNDFRSHSMLLYPNPTVDKAVLRYTLSTNDMISITLTDMRGNLLKTVVDSLQQTAGTHQQVLDVPHELPAGAYVVTLSSSSGRTSRVVVK